MLRKTVERQKTSSYEMAKEIFGNIYILLPSIPPER